ncbi:response regulator transcription factor [Actinomadura kijaniata]|uniref:response regulator transcription factor n=1 Tax=Actinomadura kijaniata TaxID=46161 RepID=UPI003F1CA305
MSTETIRLVLADDQHLVRLGLRMLCDSADDVEVVAEASDGHEATRLVAEHRPDVVLMDLRMPRVDGITATRRIAASHPATRVVALTTFDDDDHLYPALAAGAAGFLTKDAPPPDILDAIRRAANDETPFTQDILSRLVTRALHAHRPPEPRGPSLPPLTARERDVLAMVGAGLSNREIAEALHVGVTTVKTHVTNLMRKTGCPNRIRLALLATTAGAAPE